MVHIENVDYILNHGLYTRDSPLFDPNYINIGDSNLIIQRHDYPVPIAGYGNLGDFIPFYFAGHTPMLLNIKTGYRGITKRSQTDIVFLKIKVDDIVQNCQSWLFTDGHAKDRMSEFFTDLRHLDDLDWDVIQDQYWRNTENDWDRQRRKQAEFMVRNHVPVACIESIIVRNSACEQIINRAITNFKSPISVVVDTTNKYYYP